MPDKIRNVAEIDPALRSRIRELVDGKKPWPLFIHGPPGTGKTCAALCLVDHVEVRHPIEQPRFVTTERLTSEWVDVVCGRFLDEGGNPTKPALYRERIRKTALMVVDDIGTRSKASDTHYEVIKLVLDLREGKPLIVTSNHGLDMLTKLYDLRVADRLSGGTVIELTGESRRRT